MPIVLALALALSATILVFSCEQKNDATSTSESGASTGIASGNQPRGGSAGRGANGGGTDMGDTDADGVGMDGNYDENRVASPTISPSSGTYASAQTVTLTSETPDAVIHYTTDGSAPTPASTVYSGPFTLGVNNTIIELRAKATKPGMETSHLAFAAFTFAYPPFTKVGGGAASAGSATQLALALTTQDKPVIVYADGDLNTYLTARQWNGTQWQDLGPAGFGGGQHMVGRGLAIALDGNDAPHVCSINDTSNALEINKLASGAWTDIAEPGITATSCDLAFDGNGNLYAAYSDMSQGGRVTVDKWDGSSWTTLGSAGISAGLALKVRIAIDKTDKPYVAYLDDDNGLGVSVQTWNGASWPHIGSTGFIAGPASNVDLAIDSNNALWVAADEAANGGRVTVRTHAGTSWVTAGSNLSVGDVTQLAIAIDHDDLPVVAWRDNGSTPYALRPAAKRFDGAQWNPVAGDEWIGDDQATGSIAMAIGSDRKVRVGFSGSSSLAVVFEY